MMAGLRKCQGGEEWWWVIQYIFPRNLLGLPYQLLLFVAPKNKNKKTPRDHPIEDEKRETCFLLAGDRCRSSRSSSSSTPPNLRRCYL